MEYDIKSDVVYNMKQKDYNRLWGYVNEYLDELSKQLPVGLIVSHGFKIDDKKAYKKLRMRFRQKWSQKNSIQNN